MKKVLFSIILLLLFGFNSAIGQSGGNVGIGTSSPAASAALDISSTERGLLIPRMSQQQIWSLQNPANGLQVFCTTDSKLYIYVSIANQWKEVEYGAGTLTPGTCGYTITKNHVAGDVAPVNKTTTYGTVNGVLGEPGKCWITSNLGADQQAATVDDASEASAGWYWQFNRKQGYKHDGSTVTPAWTITGINENSDWQAANDPCTIELGTDWRIPTNTEWYNVDNAGSWVNWNGPWDSDLKLHASGYLYYGDGSLDYRGYYGCYWSSTQIDYSYGRSLDFNSSYCGMYNSNKAYGSTLRCLRDF
ncbi:MAG: fibrobacter succinogenes major paralogous domain-containing protein [Bacteroidales bacterium]|nr:fibrobacter succinogenes major paralogous domain-containing protein [Bacteroidales bacterium]